METKVQDLQETESNTKEDRFLVFTIGEQDYAIEIHYVIEIIEPMPLTPIPFLPGCIKGIINVRGDVIPVMDVRMRFGLPEQEYTEHTCIIHLDNDGVSLGLIVDEVQSVMRIPESERMPLPDEQATEASMRYLKSVGSVNQGIQLLLDCDKLMDIQG